MKNKRKAELCQIDAVEWLRIKVCLPTYWCEVNHNSPVLWFKGKIVAKLNEHTIVYNIWNKKFNIRIRRMMCISNGEIFEQVYKL